MKPITAIVPDFREALQEGMEQIAETVTNELKEAGPYWTGFFESLWVVQPGRAAVKANISDPSTNRKKRPRDLSPTFVPDSPNLAGYTIGNRAIYRLYAMDVLPSPTGRQQGNAPNKTAPKFWYDTYRNAKMGKTIQRELSDVFRRYR